MAEHGDAVRFAPRIDVVELLGSETYVYFSVECDAQFSGDLLGSAGGAAAPVGRQRNEVQVVARLAPTTRVAVGQEAMLSLDVSGLKLFDPRTGDSVLEPAVDTERSSRATARTLSGGQRRRGELPRTGFVSAPSRVSSATLRAVRIEDVVRRLERIRVVPLATLDASVARRVGETLVEAGLPCIEIAFRAPGAVEAIREAARVEGLLVGAGTVLRPEQATSCRRCRRGVCRGAWIERGSGCRQRCCWAAVLPRRGNADRDRARSSTWVARAQAVSRQSARRTGVSSGRGGDLPGRPIHTNGRRRCLHARRVSRHAKRPGLRWQLACQRAGRAGEGVR